MLEYRLEPEGGLLVCALGTLEVGGGQIVECSLCLSDILPERRVALAVELLEGEQLRGTRLYTVPPHHEDGPADVRIEGIRFYLPGGAGTGGADSPVPTPTISTGVTAACCPDPFEGPFGALKIYACIFRLLSL